MTTEDPKPNIELIKFYIKDISFENPNSPDIFKDQSDIKTNIEVSTDYNTLEKEMYEVLLKINILIETKANNAVIIEMEQAGLFALHNIPKDQIKSILETFCSNMLFPYAREEISNLTLKGGLPPLLLAPVNFDILYQQKMQANEVIKH